MTEMTAPAAAQSAKELLALNPTQETEFRKKVQEVKKKKKKSAQVGANHGRC